MPGYNNGRIVLGNINDEDFNYNTRNLTAKLLNNLEICERSGLLYPRKRENGGVYASNGFGLVGFISVMNKEKHQRELNMHYFRDKRALKEVRYRGSNYPYREMPLPLLELESMRIADALGKEI